MLKEMSWIYVVLFDINLIEHVAFSGIFCSWADIVLAILFYFLVYCFRESEYAAWTLVNGYALNHVTISTHQLKSHIRNIKSLNEFIEDHGFKLNSEGGTLKGLWSTLSVPCLRNSLYKVILIVPKKKKVVLIKKKNNSIYVLVGYRLFEIV